MVDSGTRNFRHDREGFSLGYGARKRL